MLVSVIIPCYNVESYIGECIDSVINQTYKNIEIICIDNNSTDSTWLRLQELQFKYPQLIVEKELNPGAPVTRNKGLTLSKGEWVQFLDADDLLLPNKIKAQVDLLSQHEKSEIAFVAGAYTKERSTGIIFKTHKPNNDSDVFVSVFSNQFGCTCSNLWSFRWLAKNNFWKENLSSSQEFDLMMRLLLSGGTAITDADINTRIREREVGQISKDFSPTLKWTRIIDIRLHYLNEIRIKFSKIYENHYPYFNTYIFSSILILAKYDLNRAMLYINDMCDKRKILVEYGVSKSVKLTLLFFGYRNCIRLFSLFK